MPEATFTHTAMSTLARDAVWARLQDVETWRGFGKMDRVWGATEKDGALQGFKWGATAAGQSWEGTAVVTESQPPESLLLHLESPEIGGEIAVALTTAGADTEITVSLTARSKGFLAGMFWPVVKDALGRGLATQVEAFGGND